MAGTAGQSGMVGRYALALFELADSDGKLDAVAGDLRAIDAALTEGGDLARMASSPVVSRKEQGAAIDAILEQAGADALTRRFIGVVAVNRRLSALHGMAQAYLTELARRRGEVTARVRSATELTETQRGALADALQETGISRNVSLEVEVDPSLIGGLVVYVGSRMIDSSISTKLERMTNMMKGAG